MKIDIGILGLVKLWAFNISSAFLDIGLVPKIPLPIELPLTSVEFMNSPHLDQILASSPFTSPIYFLFKLLIVILILYSIYYLLCHANRRSSIFLIVLIVIPFIGITFQDLILGGVGSTIVGYRFFVPVIIGAEIAVAFLLVSKISGKIWQLLTIIILILGLGSCIAYFSADSWWTLRYGYHINRIAPVINNADNPLVITKFESQILAFPHHLDPKTRLITIEKLQDLKLSEQKGNVFIYDFSPEHIEELNNIEGINIEEVNSNDRLWLLKKAE